VVTLRLENKKNKKSVLICVFAKQIRVIRVPWQTSLTKIVALLYGITCVILRSSGRQACGYFMLSK
jgi:hypothetical protein